MKELDVFGLDQETLSSIGVSIFGVIGAYGQYRQSRLIWEKRSALAVSLVWTLTFTFMFLAYLIHGLNTESLTMTIQGLLRAFFYIPILAGIMKFGDRLTMRHYAFISLLCLGTVSMIAFRSLEGHLFLLYGWLGVVMVLDQSYRIWQKKTIGSVSLTMLITLMTAVVFWSWYAWLIHDLRLFWLSVAFVAVYATTIIFWQVYRRAP